MKWLGRVSGSITVVDVVLCSAPSVVCATSQTSRVHSSGVCLGVAYQAPMEVSIAPPFESLTCNSEPDFLLER